MVDPSNTQNASIAYDQSSIKVVKIDAGGNSTDVSSDQYTLTFTGSETDSNFKIEDLPQLSAGECYEVTYTADADAATTGKYAKISNSASSQSGDNTSWSWCSNEIKSSVQKTGYYDAASDRIYWTITVNEDKSSDVSSWQINDTTPYTIAGDVTITNSSGNTVKTITNLNGSTNLNFKLGDYIGDSSDEARHDTYYIKYATKAPTGTAGESFTATNTVNVTDGGSNVGTSTGTVDGQYRDWDVAKNFESTEFTHLADGYLSPKWNAEVTVPAGDLTTFTYTDTFGAVTDADGNVIEGAEHYTTAAQLESELKSQLQLIVDDDVHYVYNGQQHTLRVANSTSNESSDVRIQVTYYDKSGNEVSATDGSTHVIKFIVEVTMMNDSAFQARSLKTGTYSTTFDIRSMKEKDSWKVKNTGTVGDKSDDADYSYTKPERFLKQVKTGTQNSASVFQSGTTTVDYNAVNGQLTYRLLLNTTRSDEGTLTIKDELPAGVKYVDGSIQARFFVSEYYSSPDNYKGTNFNGNAKPQVITTDNEDGTTKSMTIIIGHYIYAPDYPMVEIQYSVSLADDPEWNDATLTERTYTNQADWGDSHDSSETKVTREREKIIKSGTQLRDANGNPYGRIQYSIVLNPAGLDLDPDSETLTLADSLSGADAFHPMLDIGSIRLCNYDPGTENHVGTELAKTSYTLSYDSPNSTINMTIPDGKAMILVYEYSLDENYTNGTKISNSATLNGTWKKDNQVEMKAQSSSAHAYQNKLTVYKIDSRNNQITLPNVAFTLKMYDPDSAQWVEVKKDESDQWTTDSDGKIEWTLLNDGSGLQTDRLYELTEVKALDGYQLDSSLHYFIWEDTASNEKTAYENAGAVKASVSETQIEFFTHRGGTMYIQNTYTRVGVQKIWANPDGSEAGIPEDTQVQVQLYKQKLKPDGYTVTTTTTSSQETWDHKYNSVTQQVIVKKRSSLTISFTDWDDKSNVVYITYSKGAAGKSTTKPMIYDGQGDFSYTFAQIDSDLNIEITVTPYNALNVEFTGYTAAPNVPDAKTAYGDPVTLTADSSTGKLSHSWDNLPQSDADGNKLYYTVEEVSVTKDGKDIRGDYTTTYSNNGGIQSGQIVITNTKTNKPEEYSLPESGGSGTSRLIRIGLFMLFGGVILLRCRKRYAVRRGGG